MSAGVSEPVEGELGTTPLAHILVYVADHRLTGVLFLDEPGGARHVVRFERGAPTRVEPADGFARLGELLLGEGLITEGQLATALAREGLLGQVLLAAGVVDKASIERLLLEQLFLRVVHLFELLPTTRYTYLTGDPERGALGVALPPADPLAVLWAGLRQHAHLSSSMDRTLLRLGDAPIRVHPSAALERFGFTAGELAAIVRIREKERCLPELFVERVASPDTLRRIVYALLITRHLDYGHGLLPVGVTAPDPPGPEPSGLEPFAPEPPALAPHSQPVKGTALGRMQLKTIAVRVVAAPDPPGDGERRPIDPRPDRS